MDDSWCSTIGFYGGDVAIYQNSWHDERHYICQFPCELLVGVCLENISTTYASTVYSIQLRYTSSNIGHLLLLSFENTSRADNSEPSAKFNRKRYHSTTH